MIGKTSLGIEIAGRDLRFAVMNSTLGKLRISQEFELRGFLDLSPYDQKAAIEKARKTYGFPARVFLSVPRECGIVRQIEFPVEIREKLRSAVALQLESLSPWPTDEIYWDFGQEIPAKGSRTIRVTVAIIPRVALEPWIDMFRSMNLPLAGASLSSLAGAHAVGVFWPGPDPTVLLACETGYVEGCLVRGSHVHSLTQSGEETAGVARSVVERLLAASRTAASDTMRFVTYGTASSAVENIAPVQLPVENPNASTGSRFGAIASAMSGFRKTGFGSNLIPVPLRYRSNHKQLIPTYALLSIAILMGMALLVRGSYQSMVYANGIEGEIRKIAPHANAVLNQQSELSRLSERYRDLDAHFKKQDYNLEVLRELARVLPPSCWLMTYSYQDGAITIGGLANNATEIQKLLGSNPLFEDVQFVSSITRDPGGKDRFTLKANIKGPQ